MTDFSLHLLGAQREFQAENLPPATSPHTGQQLRRVKLELQVPGDLQDDLENELKGAAAPAGQPLAGEGTTWLVTSHSYSYTDAAQPLVYTHRLELQEVEELRATAVEVAGLTLVPIQYKEDVDEETLLVTLVIDVSGEEGERLEELIVTQEDQYVDVIRRGVSETPVRMRFGRCLWQQGEGDTRRHNLTLVADEGQPDRPLGFAAINQPQLGRTIEKTVANAKALDLLVEQLRSQGVLTEEAAATIKAAALPHDLTLRESREFCRTSKIENFWR
ncbi:hypothetical protein [Streptomyces lavenduligriseus]|uniref:Uncharacterized protein n=1 Tax=Streptomyces lavenduligriseus TaxID=67315 RepID=A0ABT0P415_9ACTN|nr:hypothetical protein [Streptomyces lavenduligriseus]MCL3998096.1 hypothetical protein [Streptomyces lavenduligriseus]